MRKLLGPALKNAMATIGAGGTFVLLYVLIALYSYRLGEWEVRQAPVLAAAIVCEGARDPVTRQCQGKEMTYPAFAQNEAHCVGRDAIVSGTLSKVRRDAVYVEGRQFVYFGRPDGRFRLADWERLPLGNRPVGVQDWGPWKLVGGCVSIYDTWFTTTEHTPWHHLWPLPTVEGPFPLPRARIQGSDDHQEGDEEHGPKGDRARHATDPPDAGERFRPVVIARETSRADR